MIRSWPSRGCCAMVKGKVSKDVKTCKKFLLELPLAVRQAVTKPQHVGARLLIFKLTVWRFLLKIIKTV